VIPTKKKRKKKTNKRRRKKKKKRARSRGEGEGLTFFKEKTFFGLPNRGRKREKKKTLWARVTFGGRVSVWKAPERLGIERGGKEGGFSAERELAANTF